MRAFLVFCAFLVSCSALNVKQERRFPDDFLFGTATASYQIEGAWDADGKTESVWDHYTHANPSLIADSSNADVTADSYHNYKRDVEMMRELGVDMYRFSMSWPRILPTGFPNKINEAGIAFYNNYINELLKYNITPIVTIFHWDLPQSLQDLGGLANPQFVQWYEDYARVLFEHFGDRVKQWITFNEPHCICYEAYGKDMKIPLVNATGVGDYLCTKYLLLAHAKAYHAYVNDYKESQGGKVGYTIYIYDSNPLTDSEEDKAATELAKQFEWRLYVEPIYSKDGGWPKELEQRVEEKSESQGFPRSRLPALTDEERNFIKGTADFFGTNLYSGGLRSATEYKDNFPVPSRADDADVGELQPEEWISGASSWLKRAPRSLYNALMDIKKFYDNPDILITENGWSTLPEVGAIDDDRIFYYREALNDVLDAIEDGVNVKGYTAWSLMDNFEWMFGYVECFGLYQVDMEHPNRTRTPKKSAYVYKEIIRSRVVDPSYEPDMSQPIGIDEGN